jgi:uncharacterized membrane protein
VPQQLTIESDTNVGAAERLASMAVGGFLVTWAIRKRSPATMAAGIVGADLIYRGASGHCGVYGALGMNTAVAKASGGQISSSAPEIQRSITINRSPEELFAFWSNPENLARIMAHFAEVTPEGGDVTRWKVRLPMGQVFEWTSQQAAEEPDRRLSWQSLPGGTIATRGHVAFEPGRENTGTEVKLWVQFEPPLGAVGEGLAKTLQKFPRAITGQALRRFKSLVETGEIPTLEHNPSARGASDSF